MRKSESFCGLRGVIHRCGEMAGWWGGGLEELNWGRPLGGRGCVLVRVQLSCEEGGGLSSCRPGSRGRAGVSPIEAGLRVRAGPALTQVRLPPEGGHLPSPGCPLPRRQRSVLTRAPRTPSRDRASLSPSHTQLSAARPAEKPPPTPPKPPDRPAPAPAPAPAPLAAHREQPAHTSPAYARYLPRLHRALTHPAPTRSHRARPPRPPRVAPLLTCRIPLTAAGLGAPLGRAPCAPKGDECRHEPGRTGDGTVTAPTPEGLAASFSTHCPARRDVTAGALVTPCE
ncbi:hypothetical protein GA0115246_105287 [Streptomyces sp. SolWspMP-sol7th]|nr:hypothetical protein GA0115246_105287 [Streptomyces sp. SolWspMP-sol7th]